MYLMYTDFIEAKKRQAGERYEQHIASLLRNDGWQVQETGREGVNDHGIDLVATKDGITRYVQCKGWKRWRVIHDDVVSQLYGAVAATVGVDHMGPSVELYIYSPASLGDYAAVEAQKLGIRFMRANFPFRHRYKMR